MSRNRRRRSGREPAPRRVVVPGDSNQDSMITTVGTASAAPAPPFPAVSGPLLDGGPGGSFELLDGESMEKFAAVLEGLRRSFPPRSPGDALLVRRLAILSWKLDRADHQEFLLLSQTAGDLDATGEVERLRRYQFALQRDFFRLLGFLTKLQDQAAKQERAEAARPDDAQPRDPKAAIPQTQNSSQPQPQPQSQSKSEPKLELELKSAFGSTPELEPEPEPEPRERSSKAPLLGSASASASASPSPIAAPVAAVAAPSSIAAAIRRPAAQAASIAAAGIALRGVVGGSSTLVQALRPTQPIRNAEAPAAPSEADLRGVRRLEAALDDPRRIENARATREAACEEMHRQLREGFIWRQPGR